MRCRHLAASTGSYKVTEWLLAQGAPVNPVDRFRSTPLEARAPVTSSVANPPLLNLCIGGHPASDTAGAERVTRALLGAFLVSAEAGVWVGAKSGWGEGR